MATYNIVLSRKAEKFLDSLSHKTVSPIINTLEALANNPRPMATLK